MIGHLTEQSSHLSSRITELGVENTTLTNENGALKKQLGDAQQIEEELKKKLLDLQQRIKTSDLEKDDAEKSLQMSTENYRLVQMSLANTQADLAKSHVSIDINLAESLFQRMFADNVC